MSTTDCVCPDPPTVSNGEVKYVGPYNNGSRAEYDCDNGYTQNGGSSLLCQANDVNCTTPLWVVDSSDSTSGTPDCQLPENIINNNSSETVQNLTFSWAYLAPILFFLILILILLLLLLLCFCCRSYWRHCCLTGCPCCGFCLQELSTTVVPVKPYPGENTTGRLDENSTHQVSHSSQPPPTSSVKEPAGGVVWNTSSSGRHSPGGSVSIIRYGSLHDRALKRSRTDLGLYYSSPVSRKPSVGKKEPPEIHSVHRYRGSERRTKGEKEEQPRQREVMVTSILQEEEVETSGMSPGELSTPRRSMETQTYVPLKPPVKKGAIFTQKPIYYSKEKDRYRSFGRRYVPPFGSIAPGGMAHSIQDHRRHKKVLGYDPYSVSSTLGQHSTFGKNNHFDSRGQPLWLPHVHQVRRDHAKTVTK